MPNEQVSWEGGQSGDADEWGNAAKVRCVTAAAGVYCDDTTSNSVVLEWDPVDGAEYWYSVPYREGGTEADKHELQVQTCSRLSIAQAAHMFVGGKAYESCT